MIYESCCNSCLNRLLQSLLFSWQASNLFWIKPENQQFFVYILPIWTSNLWDVIKDIYGENTSIALRTTIVVCVPAACSEWQMKAIEVKSPPWDLLLYSWNIGYNFNSWKAVREPLSGQNVAPIFGTFFGTFSSKITHEKPLTSRRHVKRCIYCYVYLLVI